MPPQGLLLGARSDRVALVESFMRQGLATHTATLYARSVASVERWCAGRGWSLAEVPGSVVHEYAGTKPYSWSSRKLLRSSLRHYWEVVGRVDPPLWAVPVPHRPRMVCRALEESEAAALAAAARARADRKGLVVLLGMYLGLRRAEIASLRWEQLGGEWLSIVGKGGIAATLPIHPAVTAHLAGLERNGDRWVFPGRQPGSCANPASINNWVRDVADEAGVGYVTPHQLRHTCLATANDMTRDLRAVQEFARHARPETTAGYTRVTRKRLLQVMAALEYAEEPESSAS